MQELNTILDVLTLIALTIGGGALFLLRAGTEAAVKTSAEEAAKAAIRQLQWPAELARELQKTRGVERQELRYKSYGALWQKLRPLALYDDKVINREAAGEMSSSLSDWYFSDCGGLLLTPQARSFYFSLQDLLRATARSAEDWDTDPSAGSDGEQRDTFRALLAAKQTTGSVGEALAVLDYFGRGNFEDWQSTAAERGKQWRAGIGELATNWGDLDRQQRFATLQQVGSILRTSLTIDLESRVY
ncbi:MAG: hypothetical protein IT320_26745 [Anaerolineae bacterium]|nr:hypothetical protein [Anaerolineae bacterium]